MYAILRAVPPPASEVAPPQTFGAGPPAPEALDAICARALAKRPKDRYASAGDMAADLEQALVGGAVAATSSRRSASARSAAGGGGGVSVGVAVGMVVTAVVAAVVAAVSGGGRRLSRRLSRR